MTTISDEKESERLYHLWRQHALAAADKLDDIERYSLIEQIDAVNGQWTQLSASEIRSLFVELANLEARLGIFPRAY